MRGTEHNTGLRDCWRALLFTCRPGGRLEMTEHCSFLIVPFIICKSYWSYFSNNLNNRAIYKMKSKMSPPYLLLLTPPSPRMVTTVNYHRSGFPWRPFSMPIYFNVYIYVYVCLYIYIVFILLDYIKNRLIFRRCTDCYLINVT